MDKWIYQINDLNLDEKECILNETIFHNANGYIGVRSNFEEGYPGKYHTIRGMYINGVYDYVKMPQAERLYGLVEEKQTIVNVADIQTVYLELSGERFSMFCGTVLSSLRKLDMKHGITERRIVWRSPERREVEIVITRMASFTDPSLFTIEYKVRPLNFSGNIKLISVSSGEVSNYCNPDDPRVAAEQSCHIQPVEVKDDQEVSVISSQITKSGILVSIAVCHKLSKETSVKTEKEMQSVTKEYSVYVEEKETVTMTKYVAVADSLRKSDPRKQAEKDVKKAYEKGINYWYQKQEKYLDEFWQHSDLEILGDEKTAIAVRFNLYQLLQSAGRDEFSNIAAKGLSGEGYEGHYFWDTEMYIQPFFILTNPEIAKKLLSYRYRILNEAKKNAAMIGHRKGALYPWRTIMGKECSGYFPSGTAAYHINGAIAYAVISYYLATGDIEFLAQMGEEMLIETARLWMDTGNYHNGRFEIHEVTGPDEYTCMVDNNYYTNACAKYNLYWAAMAWKILKKAGMHEYVRKKTGLTDEEAEEFTEASVKMYLPYDEKLNINPQDDTFLSKKVWNLKDTPKEKFPLLLHYHPLLLYRYQVCKQADTVLAHFLFEDYQNTGTMKNSFEYYEKITTHDSSLSTCIFSIMASKFGERDKAYQYFGDSAKLDLFNTHHNTADGIHTANMGGVYMAVVYGFCGLRIKETGLSLNPYLPDKWEKYSFPIIWRGSRIKVQIFRERCVLTLVSGNRQKLRVWGREYELKAGEEITCLRNKYEAVIFDLDGVICHTDQYHYQAWKMIAAKLGIPFDRNVNNHLRGVSRLESLEIILKGNSQIRLTEDEKREICTEKNNIYKKLLENMSINDLSSEVKGTLETLRERGMLLAIGSSSRNAVTILSRIGLGEYFDAVSDGNNIRNSKPDPEVFLKAAEMLGTEPGKCLVVEDSRVGILAASLAGMDSAAIGDATCAKEASYKLNTFSDLLNIC